jgi:cobalt-zinc-cadmium efflux system outer membrane protein
MDDAVRLALERNQTLRAQRLNIDLSKADEVTAGLKPNPNLSFGFAGFPTQPSNWSGTFFGQVAQYSGGIDYTFERGGKRDKRITAAQLTTDVTAKSVVDDERQTRFQTQQAFINVQLAKSTLEMAQQNLTSFSTTVETTRARVTAGDLAEGDFLQIQLQMLQFQQDLSSAELGLVQAKATLRQLVGFDTVPEDFDVAGDLAHLKVAVTLDDLRQTALASRPDLQAATASVAQAAAQSNLEIANRAVDVDGNVGYSRNAIGPISAVGVGVSFPWQLHDKNQGNIAHAQVALNQAWETEAATRATVLTDVASAFAQYRTNDKVLTLYESGYLDQAKQALDIATYVFQQGAGSYLTLLDAERTYRSIQLAYRQALAAYVTSVFQINFVVGKQVIP